MKTLVCKKCGTTMTVDFGECECPVCGAVYYILPDETPAKTETPPTKDAFAGMEGFTPITQITSAQDFIEKAPELDISKAGDDDIFRTSTWKTVSYPDETQAFKPVEKQPVSSEPAPMPVRRTPPVQNRDREASGPSPKQRQKNTKRMFIVSAVALLAVLTLVLAIMSGAFDFSKDGEKKTMPSVINLTEEHATTLLTEMGLKVTRQEDFSDTVVEGSVIQQSVKEGKIVKDGDTVMLTISKGRDESQPTSDKEAKVPYIVGKTYDQANRELSIVGLLIARAADQYSDKPEGQIISQTPENGTVLKEGDIVTVIVSKGAEPSPSPTGYSITVTSGAGGTVSPKGLVTVPENESKTFAITPNEGYEVREVKVDGTSVGAVNSYTFSNVTGDHTLYVVFQVKVTPTPTPTPATPTPTPATPTPSPTE